MSSTGFSGASGEEGILGLDGVTLCRCEANPVSLPSCRILPLGQYQMVGQSTKNKAREHPLRAGGGLGGGGGWGGRLDGPNKYQRSFSE